MRHARGFVLVNALIIVAALSVILVLALAQVERGRATLAAGVTAQQLEAYLDAGEALAQTRLAQDAPEVDHPGEAWLRPVQDVAIDRGRITVQISDPQGRFNLNWLAADPQSERDADALATYLQLTGTQARAIADLRARIEEAGLITVPEEDVPPGFALLHWQSAVNVNAASPALLTALIPGLAPGEAARIIAGGPYLRQQDFLGEVLLVVGEFPEDLKLDRFAVTSPNVEVQVTATLEGLVQRRRLMLRRGAQGARSAVEWRVTAPVLPEVLP